MVLKISNRDARRLWLDAQRLGRTPTGPLDLLGIIRDLGFVQLDTIQSVSRAHHHILWSRNQNYREPMLNRLLKDHRQVFEHFTHDAAVLPMEFYPLWQRQFRRQEERIRGAGWYTSMLDADGRRAIRDRIEIEGPLSTRAFDTKVAGRAAGKKEMWARPPHKLALDYMWYAGDLSTSHRQDFRKFYDLTDRVVPEALRRDERNDSDQLDWLCTGALDRMAFGTVGDIKRFWDAADMAEVRTWADKVNGSLVDVEIQCADGSWHACLAPLSIETRLGDTPPPTSRLRLLNPFDPVIRDRTRLMRLFGFDYRIEIFVPVARRRWGYYVYPLLEGDRFVGRIEVRANRREGSLIVLKFWPEPGVRWTPARRDRLAAELERLKRFVGATTINWQSATGA